MSSPYGYVLAGYSIRWVLPLRKHDLRSLSIWDELGLPLADQIHWTHSPGQTALDGLITTKKRQKVVSRETADLVPVEDELQPRCRRCRTWRKIGTASDAEESFELLKTLERGQARTAHVVRTCNTCETHVIIRVPAVIKS